MARTSTPKTKATRASKNVTVSTDAPVETPVEATAATVVETTTVVDTPAVVEASSSTDSSVSASESVSSSESSSTDSSVSLLLSDIVKRIDAEGLSLRMLAKDVRKVQKLYGEELKVHQRESRKAAKKAAKKKNSNKTPSGFANPGPISEKLSEFLGLPKESMIARTEVTKILSKYIKDNKLQVETNKRTFVPDAKLQGLFGTPDGEAVHFFKIQTLMKQHYISAAPVVAAAVTEATA